GSRMPRWQRMGKRLLLILLAATITIKVHLDFKLLSQPTSTPHSLWQRNDSVPLKLHRNHVISDEGSRNISGGSSSDLEATRYHDVALGGGGGGMLHGYKDRQQPIHLLQHPITNETSKNQNHYRLEESKKDFSDNNFADKQSENMKDNFDKLIEDTKLLYVSEKIKKSKVTLNVLKSVTGKANNKNSEEHNKSVLSKKLYVISNNTIDISDKQIANNISNNVLNNKDINNIKWNDKEDSESNMKAENTIIKSGMIVQNIEQQVKIDKEIITKAKELTINPEKPKELFNNQEKPKELTINQEKPKEFINNQEKPEELTYNPEKPKELENNAEKPKEFTNNAEKPKELPNTQEKPKELTNNPEKPKEITNNPEKPKELANNAEKTKKLTNNPEKPKELPNNPEKPKELTNNADKTKELINNPEKPIELPNNTEKPKEPTNNAEKPKELPNNPEKSNELTNNAEKPKELANNAEKSNELTNNAEKPKELANNAEKPKEPINDPDKPHHIPVKIRVADVKPNSNAKPPPAKLPAPPIKKAITKAKGVVVSHKVDESEIALTEAQIANITMLIQQINNEQLIYNLNKYGPITNDTIVFIIQVHNRLVNLKYLVESLAAAQGINSSLVVFSHDLWNPEINKFIKNITAFRHMQMFFPFSIQLNPRTFPGRDPRDCRWDIHRDRNLQCLNREWPDSYGHFREAAFTQIKHHWWWKIYRLFEEVRVVRKGSWLGKVVFLEEDHIVAPDILHVLKLMNQQRSHICATCNIYTLGNYNKLTPASYQNIVEKGDWWVTKHNLGFVLDYKVWQGIKACGIQFCEYDDYNWDWTLSSLIHTCIKPKLSMLHIKFARVMHVGSCGTHIRKSNCDIGKEVAAVKQRYKTGQQWLFPKTLKMQGAYHNSQKPKKGNGGWGDFRDRLLCRAMSIGKASQNTIKSLQFLQQQEKT
ncbi:unnamed protein product, partial [Meganyctiphanes norvegica]